MEKCRICGNEMYYTGNYWVHTGEPLSHTAEPVVKKYVVGFAFTENRDQVLLVEKLRPEWQKGCLNGVGGKIEEDEAPIQAMHRECFEEAGVCLFWEYRGVMNGINNDGIFFECHIFYSYSDGVKSFMQMEDESLHLFRLRDLKNHMVVPNLDYLIPFGLAAKASFITLTYDGHKNS